MKNKILLISAMVLSLIILIYIPTEEQNKTPDIKVYTSVYSFKLLVEEIGGDNVIVENLFPIDSDNHTYEMTGIDAKNIENSDVVFYLSEENDKNIYDISQTDDDTLYVNITDSDIFKNNVSSDLYKNEQIVNEHIWLSPQKLSVASQVIAQTLCQIDSANTDEYEKNFQTVETRLDQIDEEYQNFSAKQDKPLIITHDAYFYLAHDYGIEYITLYGEDHDDEPSSAEILEVINTIEDNGIENIFVEQNDVDNPLMEQISLETQTKEKVINNISSQSSYGDFSGMDIYELLEYNLQVMSESGV